MPTELPEGKNEMSPFITVNQGGAQIADGVYPVTLVDIKGPKTVTAQRGPKAGQDIDLLDWEFAIDEGDYDGTVIQASTSTASGPKSKMFGFLTALFGGKAPNVGAQFELIDLRGRRALATIRNDDQGWPRIDNLGAMPASMLSAGFARATGTPTTAGLNLQPAAVQAPPERRPIAAPAKAAAADPADALPF